MRLVLFLLTLCLPVNGALADTDGLLCTADKVLNQWGHLDGKEIVTGCRHQGMVNCETAAANISWQTPMSDLLVTALTYTRHAGWIDAQNGSQKSEDFTINRNSTEFTRTLTTDFSGRGVDWIREYTGHCVKVVIKTPL